MFKILDRYIAKTFLGPFLFIFSVLFFIFIVNIVWIQLGHFFGKGLSYWQILKLLFYLGVGVISLVLPLTVLLSSIMTFGELGERYELAAMKAAGISLTRAMLPLFVISIGLSVVLFLFSNNIIPDFQRKAKNMLFNIATSKPALNFTPGQFIDQIPGYLVKFDKITGENQENIEGVFIHKKSHAYDNKRTVLAKRGKFVKAENKKYIKLELYDGYVFEEDLSVSYQDRLKQPNQAIKFDTLTSLFDVSELIEKAIEDERITDDYRFRTYGQLHEMIDKTKKTNETEFTNINNDLISQANPLVNYIDKQKPKTAKIKVPIALDSLKKEQKLLVINSAYNQIELLQNSAKSREDQIKVLVKYYGKVVMWQQRIIATSITCIIFFLIGASLGSIIRKGGLGLPVVIAIVIFIIYYVLNLSVENLAWDGKIGPYLAAWIPNMILLPFGIWLSYKALTDSQLFDIEKYKALIKPVKKVFLKDREHKRYQ